MVEWTSYIIVAVKLAIKNCQFFAIEMKHKTSDTLHSWW